MSLNSEEVTPQGVDKIARYNWEEENSPGDLLYIHKSKLSVDPTYQRDPKSDKKVIEIAKSWNWVSLGAIIVAQRENGQLFVVDGQHRVLAAMKRSDVKELPCVVHKSGGAIEEATAFIESNTGRQAVKTHEQHRARLVYGDDVAVHVQRLLDEGGKFISTGGSPANGLRCLGVMYKLARNNPRDLDRVWPLIAELTEGHHTSERVVEGLVYIERNMPEGDSLTSKRWSGRIISIGNDELVKAAGEGAAFFAKGGAKPWAAGIVNRINKGLKKKLEVIK